MLHSPPLREGDAPNRAGLDADDAVSVILKDLVLIHEFARDHGARLPLGGMSRELYREAVALGHANTDMSAMCLPLERIADTEIRPRCD
ncbi:MAG: NAD-binding protein [Chloroflexi bacterium]|nr:NAD-binding protein [Chloroflexota bacterium]